MNCNFYATAELQFSESDPTQVKHQAILLLEEFLSRQMEVLTGTSSDDEGDSEFWRFRALLRGPERCQVNISLHPEDVIPEVLSFEVVHADDSSSS
jgi:hypothetical protein